MFENIVNIVKSVQNGHEIDHFNMSSLIKMACVSYARLINEKIMYG